MSFLPDNFKLLHNGEELIRTKSVEAIRDHESLPAHFEVVERAMSLFNHFACDHPNNDDNQLIIQFLGIRLFNTCASNVKLMTTGYYQAAASGLRDMLEVSFLLDYFLIDKARIAVWKGSTESERIKQFGPAKIRIALDTRDGFTEKKREEHYKMLCTMGAHATMQGFEMLRSKRGGNAHSGPFFALDSLVAVVEETAKISISAATTFTRFFSLKTKTDAMTKIALMEQTGLWLERFFKHPYNSIPVNELKLLVASLPD